MMVILSINIKDCFKVKISATFIDKLTYISFLVKTISYLLFIILTY